MQSLQEHARKRGVLVTQQKQMLQNYAGLFPIVEVGAPGAIYLPIGMDHESPLEHNVRATDFLFDSTRQHNELLNRAMNPGMVIQTGNIRPTLVRPQMLARAGDRVNIMPLLDSPYTRIPLASRGSLGDRVGPRVPGRYNNEKADSMNLYE